MFDISCTPDFCLSRRVEGWGMGCGIGDGGVGWGKGIKLQENLRVSILRIS